MADSSNSIAAFIASNIPAKYKLVDFKINKTASDSSQIQLHNFDSLNVGEACFVKRIITLPNKPDGELSIMDENMNQRYHAKYQNGDRHGNEFYWYESGQAECINSWSFGTIIKSECFYETGTLRSSFIESPSGQKMLRSYYPNGQLISFYDEERQIEYTYFDNGNIQTQRDDRKNSYLENYPNGSIKTKGKIQKDQWKRKGKWYYYNPKGALIKVLFYKKGNSGWYKAEAGWYKKKEYQGGS
ncbi:MAG: hypothetical protein ACFB10_08400 [Salibacteraceae bacterium]